MSDVPSLHSLVDRAHVAYLEHQHTLAPRMTRRIYCDGDDCAQELSQPITVGYYIDPDLDEECDEDGYTEAHFCGWACLTNWAMAEALDGTE